MFIHMSIHVPNPGFEQEVLASLNRVRLAALGTPGLMHIGPWREDETGGRIVGIAMWESRAHWEAALPTCSRSPRPMTPMAAGTPRRRNGSCSRTCVCCHQVKPTSDERIEPQSRNSARSRRVVKTSPMAIITR